MASGTVAAAILNALQGIILARTLGPEGTGQYQLPVAMAIIIATFCVLGIGRSNIYFLNHCKIEPSRVVTNSLYIGVILGFIASAAMYLNFLFGQEYVGIFNKYVKYAFSIGVGFMTLQSILRTTLIAQMRILEYNIMQLAIDFITIIGVIIAVIMGYLWVDTVLFILALVQILGIVITLFMLRNNIKLYLNPDLHLLWGILTYGLKLYIVNLILMMDQRISLVILAFMLPGEFEALGYFSRAVAICSIIRLIPGSLFDLLYSYWALNDGKENPSQIERIVRLYMLFGLIIIAIFLLLGKEIIIIMYGEKFLPSLASLQILAVQQMLWSISKVFQALFSGDGKPMITTLNMGTAMLLNIIITFLLVPHMGIVGAAIAATLGQIVYVSLNLFQAKKNFGLRLMGCIAFNYGDIKLLYSVMKKKRFFRSLSIIS